MLDLVWLRPGVSAEMERHEEDVEERRLAMTLAQRRVLDVYGLLLDLSRVDVAALHQFNKRKALPVASEDMTWARWGRELFGESSNLRIITPEVVAGQTRLSTVRSRMGQVGWLADELQEGDRVRLEQGKQIDALEKADRQRKQPTPRAELLSPHPMTAFYFSMVCQLLKVLETIEDVEGDYRESNTVPNKQIRKRLADIIAGEGGRGYRADFFAKLEPEVRERKNPFPEKRDVRVATVSFRRWDGSDRFFQEHSHPDFTMEGLQGDVVSLMGVDYQETPSGYIEPDYAEVKVELRFKLFHESDGGMSDQDLRYLTSFYRRLFAALCRAGDHKPRASIREAVMLACFWAWTAPGMPLEQLVGHKQDAGGWPEEGFERQEKKLPAAVFERFVGSVESVITDATGLRVLRDWR